MPNPVGRPLKYKSVEEMQSVIDEYFNFCDNRIQQVWSPKSEATIEIIDPEAYTMSGLALALGFESRQSLLNYAEKDEFLDTIKRARMKVESDVERRSIEKGNAGTIFNLKNNCGWKDKREEEITGNLEIRKIVIN